MIRLPATRRRRIMLTPLIDVVFLLVMFFMLSSTFVPLRRLDVGIAAAGTGQAMPAADTRTLLLTIGRPPGARGGIAATLDGVALAADAVEARLRQAAGGAPALVLLQMREGTSVQDLVTALEAVQASGIGAARVLTR